MLSSAVVLAASAAEPQTGWGNPVALTIAALGFWGFTHAYRRWKKINADPPCPADTVPALGGVNPQVSDTSDTNGKGLEKGPRKGPLPVPAPAAAAAKPLDKFVAARAGKARTSAIVAAAGKRFGASKSTVMRALRKARQPDTTVDGAVVADAASTAAGGQGKP